MSVSTNRDVASRACVSIATVSRVLNGSPHVNSSTRGKVLLAVKELDYHPNRVAQRLRAKQSRVLGVIIPDIQNPFFTSIVRGIEDVAYQEGYSVVLCNSDEQPGKEQLYIDVMRAEAVGGVILTRTLGSSFGVSALLDQNIPVVAVDRRANDPRIDSVLVANEEGAFEAVSHLCQLGHRHIAFIGLPVTCTPGKERYEGYRRALREYGLHFSRQLSCIGDAKQPSGYGCALSLLEAQPSISALFVANNLMTLGALNALRDRGLLMPKDISVVGFDDMPFAALLEPPLSTVAQPTYELGRKAAELLLERLQDPAKPVVHVQLKTELIVRGSCGRPAR